MKIQGLQNQHDINSFSCGINALDHWLHCIAKQHNEKGISRTYVAVDASDPKRVLGFYSITVGQGESGDTPPAALKKLPNKFPIALIGRLGVSADAQNQGIGGILLIDALRRIVRVSADIGISVIMVDAKDGAAGFYQHYGFISLPDQPQRLVMPIKTAAEHFRAP